MLPELYAKLTDEYEMDADEARRLVLEKLGDQLIPVPVPVPTEPEEQTWRTEPATAAQTGEILGLIQAIGGETGQELTDMMLAHYGASTVQELNGAEAAAIISALDKAPPELWEAMLAWNKAETLGLSWPEAAVLMGAGGAGAGAAVGLTVKGLFGNFSRWTSRTFGKRLGARAIAHGAKVHTLVPAQRGLLARLFSRTGKGFFGGPGGLSPAFAPLAVPFETEFAPGAQLGLRAAITPEQFRTLSEEEREMLRLARESAARLARARQRGPVPIAFRRPVPIPRRELRF